MATKRANQLNIGFATIQLLEGGNLFTFFHNVGAHNTCKFFNIIPKLFRQFCVDSNCLSSVPLSLICTFSNTIFSRIISTRKFDINSFLSVILSNFHCRTNKFSSTIALNDFDLHIQLSLKLCNQVDQHFTSITLFLEEFR